MAKEKEKPLTREDVLRLIEENGGTAKGLDLSGKVFEEGINFSRLNLKEIILDGALFPPRIEFGDPDEPQLVTKITGANFEKADLSFASLNSASLWEANLQQTKLYYSDMRRAYLSQTKLHEANLSFAKLQGTNFEDAHFYRADLHGAEFNNDTNFDLVHWADYRLGEEEKGLFAWAEDTYRKLKIWHTNAGMYDRAGEFSYREMTARRKVSWWGLSRTYLWRELLRPFKPKELLRALFPQKPLPWTLSMLYDLLCGYGEKPWKVVMSAAVVVCGLATAYHFWGSFSSSSFWDTLYYSAASFTALGYGQWAPQPSGWAKAMGAAEAFIGVFMIALFLITFTRKMTR